ncbi:MAG: hypothetical protein V3U53_02085 [bacterium]
MSIKLDSMIAETGTKFKIFSLPRNLKSFEYPETIRVSVNPQMMEAGPADSRMYILDPADKIPYEFSARRQPYSGPLNPPVQSGPDGHFDHLAPNTREFSCAALYANARRVLDIWEDYMGREIAWPFTLEFSRLELIPLTNWDNAQSGWGYLEFGYPRTAWGGVDRARPYCENFCMVAREIAYFIVLSEVGIPGTSSKSREFNGFLRSAIDISAVISLLHFHKVLDHVLDSSAGNLFSINELNRLGELAQSQLFRAAFNYERTSTVGESSYEMSLPLTGAIFDILIEVYKQELVNARLIDQDLADRADVSKSGVSDEYAVQTDFDIAYINAKPEFKTVLCMSRDYLGSLLARAWSGMYPHDLSFHDAGRHLLFADSFVSGGRYQDVIRECFAWREIALPSGSMAMRSRRLKDSGPH